MKRIKAMISDEGDAFTPYGATEALPVACQSASAVLKETAAATYRGAGTCVGSRFEGIRWKVIEISDAPLENIEDTNELPPGQMVNSWYKAPSLRINT